MQVESCQPAIKYSSHQMCVHVLSRSPLQYQCESISIMTKGTYCPSTFVIAWYAIYLFIIRVTDLISLLSHLHSCPLNVISPV